MEGSQLIDLDQLFSGPKFYEWERLDSIPSEIVVRLLRARALDRFLVPKLLVSPDADRVWVAANEPKSEVASRLNDVFAEACVDSTFIELRHENAKRVVGFATIPIASSLRVAEFQSADRGVEHLEYSIVAYQVNPIF